MIVLGATLQANNNNFNYAFLSAKRGESEGYMLYYKVIRGDVRDHFSGYTTIKNELLTPKERNKKFRYLSDDVFQTVEVSRKKTFFNFGARFEMQ